MRSLLGRFHRPNARSQSEQLFMLNNLGDGSTLSLDFTTGVLDPRLTFTRSTTGTYINSSGYVTSAAINAPRFDYDPSTLTPRGLLIEGSANNLVTRSQTLNQAAWLKAATTILETGTGSPANDATSNILTWTNGTAVGSAYTEQSSLAVSASQPYTWSVWLKNRGNQRVSVFGFTKTSTNTFSGNLEMTVDFSVATPTATITTSTNFTSTSVTTPVAFGNGWYRCTMTGTTPSTAAVTGFGISNKDAVPASGTNGCEIWGAQLEAGSGASSYIPTTSSTGNRAADFAVLSDLSAIGFNTAGGSMVMRGYQTKLSSGSFPALAAFLDSGDVDVFGIRNDVAGAVMFGRFAGTSTSAEATRTITNNAAYAFGMSADPTITTGAITVSMNGSSTTANKIGSATAITTPTKFAITRPGYGLYINCGTIRSIKYWPSIKTAAELNSLTT